MSPAPDRVKARIVAREKPCSCGCKGRDPWHARHFEREIARVRETREPEVSIGGGIVRGVYREGVARFPWGVERVVEIGVGLASSDFRSKWWKIADR